MKTFPARVFVFFLVLAAPVRAIIAPDLQDQLGHPSGATADPSNRSHYLLRRAQFSLDFNDTLGDPNWVSWDLTTGDVGSSGRSNFIRDPDLPATFTRLTTEDYTNSGFDRGHMCPSADRTVTTADNQVTFYMSNVVPQQADNNQGPWEAFESYCRTLAHAGHELLITCGPGGFGGSRIPSGKAAIPGFVWKIAVVVPLGPGAALSRIDAATRVIAIKMPNVAGIRSVPWQNYIVSAAQLEADTGYTFFTALPAPIAAALRTKVDGQPNPVATAPEITRQPASPTAPIGASATFSVTASGATPLTYQWRKDGAPVAGATSAALTLTNLTPAHAGSYTVAISNSAGSIVSNPATLTVIRRSYAGTYFGAFLGNAASTGGSSAVGSFALHLRADNTGVFLGHEMSYALAMLNDRVVVGDDGRFRFRSSAISTLELEGAIHDDGSITAQPRDAGTRPVPAWTLSGLKAPDTGMAAALVGYYRATAAAADTTLHTIVGANGRAFVVVQSAQRADDGPGQLGADGRMTVSAGGLSIACTIDPATQQLDATATAPGRSPVTFAGFAAHAPAASSLRMLNLSTRTMAGPGAGAAIVGFVVSGLESKPLLVRAIGPGLRGFGLTNALTTTRLELVRSGASTAWLSNAGWSTAANAADIANTAARVGAFALASGSADSAVVATLPPGAYSAVVTPPDGRAGITLIEVYDLSEPSADQRLANLSARATAGSGDATLTAGFVIGGGAPKRVLVRAAGPALPQFGVPGALARPQLTLVGANGVALATNGGWEATLFGLPVADAAARTGAFPFTAGSADAALVLNLAPGPYTAQVTSADNATGAALIEVYEVP